jgi:RNA recognition motif-containing protein
MQVKDGFEMVERPNFEIERVHQNMRENMAPNFLGEHKLYVGNIAFECKEDDIYELFSTIGNVGDVSLVRDDFGKNRGFGFVTMRTNAEGDKAIDELNGAEMKGRNIAVRPSSN